MLAAVSNVLRNISKPIVTSTAAASGRWWPQPDRRCFSGDCASSSSDTTSVMSAKSATDVVLRKEDAAPVYYTPRGDGKKDAWALLPWKNNEQIANYPLFEAAIARAKVPWLNYKGLTSEERTVYLAHLRAVEERRLSYKCPITGFQVFTISQLLYNGKCCGNACRHCPYEHENVPAEKKGRKVWNGVYYV